MGKEQELLEAARTGNLAAVEKLLSGKRQSSSSGGVSGSSSGGSGERGSGERGAGSQHHGGGHSSHGAALSSLLRYGGVEPGLGFVWDGWDGSMLEGMGGGRPPQK